jgi:integrase
MKGVIMTTATPQKMPLVTEPRIRRIRCQPDDTYQVIFVDQNDRIVVPLTEWYRLRKQQGPGSTRETYLTCLMPFLAFLIERECPWNAPPERLRPVLIQFHRERLGCQIHPKRDQDAIGIVPTSHTPVCESTLRVIRAALRDFYLVLKDAGLYAFPNPLSSETLTALKREQTQILANRGAPDDAGTREETRVQSRRRPTALLQYPNEQGWKPNLRKTLADVRKGIHDVLNCMIDSPQVPPREKAVLELLQNTGARLHEIVLMTVGGYRNDGIAGQAQVMNKGSYGREIKTIYFARNPRVEQALSTYIDQVRPLHDRQKRSSLMDLADQEPLFLTERGTSYSPKSFYYHWYKHYKPLQDKCPVRFSPHDIRHLFVSEFLIRLKLKCGLGTDHYDAEQYLREREAFGYLVMGWHSPETINIYDQTRDGEGVMSTVASLQRDLSERRYVPERVSGTNQDQQIALADVSPLRNEGPTALQQEEIIWIHDAETLAWIKKQQQYAKQLEREEN